MLSYTRQLLAGLAFLAQRGVVHADLKPDNLVVNQSMALLKVCTYSNNCVCLSVDV